MNCIIVNDEEMSINAMKHLVSQIPFLTLIGVYHSAGEALTVINDKNVDLVLLDVDLPDMNGLEFLKSLRNPPLTILVTSKKEYAIEAFECNIIDYLLKPVSIDRFFKAIARSKFFFDTFPQTSDTTENEYAFVKINGMLVKINIKEILWIEALGDYVKINTADKKYTIHSTLKSIENKFCPEKFIRVHRSYIVAVDNIDSIDDNTICIDKQLIPIGYMYKDNLTKRLNLL